MRSYVERAATLVLVWSELEDDTPAAEACRSPEELTARRAVFRRGLRTWLERARPAIAAEKWVQRAFWAAPPRRGFLDPEWKDVLLAWAAAMRLDAEAYRDVDLATRGLFADGEDCDAELLARRPGLSAVAARCVVDPGPTPILSLAAPQVLEDALLPMYLTDPTLSRLVWSNRSFQAFMGLARDQVQTLSFLAIQERFGQMAVAGAAPYHDHQEAVKAAGQVVGRAILDTEVDLGRRSWVGGVPTPPWEGRYHVTIHAHFVLDPLTGDRLGSFVVIHPLRSGA